MNILDRAIGVFSPGWQAARLKSRNQVQAYEAATPTKTHRGKRERRTADQLTRAGSQSLREQARYLDDNHDLVIGVLDKLEERVIGENGIAVDPLPRLKDGTIDKALAGQISRLWGEWSVNPEVTGEFNRGMLERMMLRSWLRDGEVFAQCIKGRQEDLTPPAGIYFWLQALECDFVPLDDDPGQNIIQGVRKNTHGGPKAYQVYKNHPGATYHTKGDVNEVSAENMLHVKFSRRFHQTRGVSMLSGVIMRLAALKEYEDAELVAARIAASLGMYIKKGDGQSYDDTSSEEDRDIEIEPGIIFDGLQQGEEIGMIKSDRPNPNLETFRSGQLRAIAAGVRLSYSSASRNYNGTFSAQRQELVESTAGYAVLQQWFIQTFTRRVYRMWLRMAISSGKIKVPANLDKDTLYSAKYRGPSMVWIDPVKEAQAWRIRIRAGGATEAEMIRASGHNPDEVKAERLSEIEENKKHGLIFDSDPRNDKGKNDTKTSRRKAKKQPQPDNNEDKKNE
ncbi:phage portal protein [Klebsiella sp. PL-2018]|uniref:phage portal protein n=1 Tax=Klebsiella sp. PL-2018 TaxID=2851540 RepID=UPI001C24A586|nr:phage portal protein [Klebsiella sp. PL-2018]QXC99325.1 Phage portal protein [Klebsiella sp. PL-2018]